MTKTNNPHIGSSLDNFLEDNALLAKTHAAAVKRTETWEAMRQAREKDGLIKYDTVDDLIAEFENE